MLMDVEKIGETLGKAVCSEKHSRTFTELFTQRAISKAAALFYLPFASERKNLFSQYHLVNIKEIQNQRIQIAF